VSYHQGNKNDPLFAASGAIQISPVTIEINKSLKKLKIELPSDPQYYFWVCTQKNQRYRHLHIHVYRRIIHNSQLSNVSLPIKNEWTKILDS
jgi:hypothetical protein